MNTRRRTAGNRLWQQVRARPRLMTSVAAGVLVALALPAGHAAVTRALWAWDAGAGLYLLLAWHMIARAPLKNLRKRAQEEDDGAAAVLFMTVAAAVASLAAIVVELSGVKGLPAGHQGLRVAWVAATFLISWLLVHTTFALHYAHIFHGAAAGDSDRPLDFPGVETPAYMDFLYFSMVIGMTSQTADVAVASPRLRRLVMAHGLVAFIFNTSLLALTVNIAASLLG